MRGPSGTTPSGGLYLVKKGANKFLREKFITGRFFLAFSFVLKEHLRKVKTQVKVVHINLSITVAFPRGDRRARWLSSGSLHPIATKNSFQKAEG